MNTKSEVIVIGAGVVGLSAAYYLARAGHAVTVLEKTDGADGCSFGNAGFIAPSHFVPLAAPGIVAKGLRWMLNPESPFYIKPRFDLSLARWGWQFMRHATHKHVNASKKLLSDLTLLSLDLHKQFAGEQQIPLHNSGIIMFCKTESCLAHEIELAAMAGEFGLQSEVMDLAQLQEYDPQLRHTGAGAVWFKDDAYMDPGMFMRQMHKAVAGLGVQVLTGREVVGFEKTSSKITKVITNSGAYQADEVVLATGSFSVPVLKLVGHKMLLEPGKGYSVDWHEESKIPRASYILVEARVAITPMGNFVRLAGTMELDGISLAVKPRRVAGFLKSIEAYLPDYKYAETKSLPVWAGLRPCSPDGLPYLGRDKKYRNLTIATGHAMVGFTLGPVTGKLVAEIVAGAQPTINIDQLAVDRY